MKVALLGAGGINGLVAQAAIDGRLPGIDFVGVAGSAAGSASATELGRLLGAPAVAPEAIPELGCDWVVEAAGGKAVRAHVPAYWRSGVNTVVMSIGALVDPAVYSAYEQATANGVKVELPSGGIAGLDGVRALAAGGGLYSVSITTTKAPAGLSGAPYLEQNRVELPADRVVTVFEGTARDAVAGFPANVNVAIALSLAGLGPDRTKVVIRSDPAAERTTQLIEAEGEAAAISISIASRPSPGNPRTSYLAAASAIATLSRLSRG